MVDAICQVTRTARTACRVRLLTWFQRCPVCACYRRDLAIGYWLEGAALTIAEPDEGDSGETHPRQQKRVEGLPMAGVETVRR